MKHIETKNMYKVQFKKLKANHEKLRSESVIGFCENLPKVGDQFIMFSHPLENPKSDFRVVNTSVVNDLLQNNKHFTLTTESKSIYSVEIIEYPTTTC